MQIIDITQKYIKHIIEENNLDSYEKSQPELFRIYFKFWAQKKYFKKTINKSEIHKRKELIEKQIYYLEKKFASYGFDISNLKIILFVGQNCTNGHVFKEKNDFTVFIPIEAYKTKLQIDVFLAHEIFHAIHYKKQPDFYFATIKEKNKLSRQLITEGISTFGVKKILKISDLNSLWADYLNVDEKRIWHKECSKRKLEVSKFIVKNFNSSDKKIELFYANDKKDVFKYRAGYFMGLEIIKKISEKYPFEKILDMPRKNLEKLAIRILVKGE